MNAGNAFAQAMAGDQFDIEVGSKRSKRPKKRARLSDTEASAAIQSRRAHEDTALEVDIMILDYLAFQATKACLSRHQDNTEAEPSTLEPSLSTADSFLEIFKIRHPSYKPDAGLQFRILLLKFTTLFVTRMTRGPATPSLSSLQDLRTANRARAHAWIGEESRIPTLPFNTQSLEQQCPLPPSMLRYNRASALNGSGLDEDGRETFYGTEASVSLLDILPLFMEVSAARTSLSNCSANASWMRLACEFMLQACLEQYMVYGSDGSDAIDEAFAWGHKIEGSAVGDKGKSGSAAFAIINEMFEDEEDEEAEVEGWSEERLRWLRKMFQRTDLPKGMRDGSQHASVMTLPSYLGLLVREHQIVDFQNSVLHLLSGLDNSIPEPVLRQVEKGRLDDMSGDETRTFLDANGLVGDSLSLFEPPGCSGSPT